MPAPFASVFQVLKPVLESQASRLRVKADSSTEYTLETKSASPFPQHKGQPLFFGSVRVGKAYVSLHLMPLYMDPVLTNNISPGLKKRMQGKACFNFKTPPEPEVLAELARLAEASALRWAGKNWL